MGALRRPLRVLLGKRAAGCADPRGAGPVLVPLQTPWVTRRLGSNPAAAPREMALLTGDGRIIAGDDAYLYVAEQLWWARALARVGRFRPIHRLLRGAYAWIAAHRQRISSACRLQPDLPHGTEVPDDRRLLH
jgi:hypothetical protein